MSDWNSDSALPSGYFNYTQSAYDNESELYEILITDMYNQNNLSADYYESTFDTSYDKLFGEDGDRYFKQKFTIILHGELPKEEQLWSRFGIEGIDNFQMFCTKRHFSAASLADTGDTVIPKVGDVIYTSYNNRIYEIRDVGQEEEMLHQRKHTWVFTLSPFTDTNISLSADTSATMGDISAFTNQDIDDFDISEFIDNELSAFDYDDSSETESPDSIWGDY